MNSVYICDFNLLDLIGVRKKIKYQLNEFMRKGYTPYLIYINRFECIVFNYSKREYELYIYKSKQTLYNFIVEKCIHLAPKFIYIRKNSIIDYFVFNFYRELRQNCELSKIIIEFPTLPYDLEIKNINLLKIDMFYRDRIRNFFDFSVNFHGFKNVFGINSISILNGIDISNIPLKIQSNNNKCINLIGVANIFQWHGFERIILGLKDYYNNYYEDLKYKICFNIIGDGDKETVEYLKAISNEDNLNEYINFCGVLEGDKLNNIFNQSDIAIASLGLYKIGLNIGNTLKTKEYCARGIPFIIGYDDLGFNIESIKYEYIMKVENNDKPINMIDVIEFYESLKEYIGLKDKMRKYAQENLTWEKNLDKVFEAIDIDRLNF